MSDRRQNRLPVIGLTSYGRIEDNKFYLPANYVDSARRAGGIPLLIPPGEEHAQVLASLLDAFVLTGGGDIDPEMYGGGSHESIYMVDNERDSTELEIAKRIVDLGRPTLGICRGTQILNVALGGTLFAHLPEEVGETVVHRVPPREPIPHPVTLQDGSRLARILQERSFSCASWHHQAIRDVAPGFDIVARAPDGTIEAIEMADHPWLIAVQWHPEMTAKEDPIQQRLFDALVEAAMRVRALNSTKETDAT